MFHISATCICNADAQVGGNNDNLLFARQILPEVNGGLAGTPAIKVSANSPFTAAVFSGSGSNGAAAAHFAANAFCTKADALYTQDALTALMSQIHQELLAQVSPDAGCSAAAVCVCNDQLSLANLGSCRAYLLRGSALYLLSRHSGDDAVPGAVSSAEPYGLSGTPERGDQLLLCTDGLVKALPELSLLKQLRSSPTGADALQQLLAQARAQGDRNSITAVLLRFE